LLVYCRASLFRLERPAIHRRLNSAVVLIPVPPNHFASECDPGASSASTIRVARILTHVASAGQAGSDPELLIHPDAVDLIREKGGTVYLGADGAGMEHIHFRPPHGRDDVGGWTELEADGVRVFVDPGIEPPDRWVIILHHLPYRHLQALWNGEELETTWAGGVTLRSGEV
jgi:hypothetical protein